MRDSTRDHVRLGALCMSKRGTIRDTTSGREGRGAKARRECTHVSWATPRGRRIRLYDDDGCASSVAPAGSGSPDPALATPLAPAPGRVADANGLGLEHDGVESTMVLVRLLRSMQAHLVSGEIVFPTERAVARAVRAHVRFEPVGVVRGHVRLEIVRTGKGAGTGGASVLLARVCAGLVRLAGEAVGDGGRVLGREGGEAGGGDGGAKGETVVGGVGAVVGEAAAVGLGWCAGSYFRAAGGSGGQSAKRIGVDGGCEAVVRDGVDSELLELHVEVDGEGVVGGRVWGGWEVVVGRSVV